MHLEEYKTLPSFAATSGPRNAKIALVAEAWGQQEQLTKQPLIGSSGQELNRMLAESGINRRDCFATNVFALRPPNNNIEFLCADKKTVGKDYKLPALRSAKYFLPTYLPELERLKEELETVQPNLIIALGAVSTWALLRSSKIGAIRGTTSNSTLAPALKVLPTYHPSAVLRNWSLRPIVLADFQKALREREFPEVRRPQRFVLVRPSISEIVQWYMQRALGAAYLAIDIETARGQIKNIGFACSRSHAINIPFVNSAGIRYWQTRGEEIDAWQMVKLFCSTDAAKVFQNGMYDLQYIWRMGINVRNVREDPMLLHHALYPEMQKGLGFLGSIYTSEPAWKLMRGKSEELKRDE